MIERLESQQRFVPPPIQVPGATVVTEYPGATKNDAMTVFLFGILSWASR